MNKISIWVPFSILLQKYESKLHDKKSQDAFLEELEQLYTILNNDNCPYYVDDSFCYMFDQTIKNLEALQEPKKAVL